MQSKIDLNYQSLIFGIIKKKRAYGLKMSSTKIPLSVLNKFATLQIHNRRYFDNYMRIRDIYSYT